MPASQNPQAVYKIDRFAVPSEAVDQFVERLRKIQVALSGRPGCLQNLLLGSTPRSDGGRDFVTVVEWESEAAFKKAGAAMQEQYATEGFEPAAFMRALGVVPAMGVFCELDR